MRPTRAMTPERWQEVEQLLDGALDLAPGERSAFLEDACGGDAELREEVERLLRSSKQAKHFLEAAAPEYAAPLVAAFSPRADLPAESANSNNVAENGRGERAQSAGAAGERLAAF